MRSGKHASQTRHARNLSSLSQYPRDIGQQASNGAVRLNSPAARRNNRSSTSTPS